MPEYSLASSYCTSRILIPNTFDGSSITSAAAAAQQGVNGLSVVSVRVAFLTHLHSDHTAGYADLILTPWSVRRSQTLDVYGPKGLKP